MADDKPSSERKIVLRAGKRLDRDTRLKGKRICPQCREVIYGQKKRCLYCNFESDPSIADTAPPEPEVKPEVKRPGQFRVDKQAGKRAGKTTAKEKLGNLTRRAKAAVANPAPDSPAQPRAEARDVLPKHIKKPGRKAVAPKRDPNMVDGMEISFVTTGGDGPQEKKVDFGDVVQPQVTPAVSIPWERLLFYLLIAVGGFGANYFLADDENAKPRDSAEYQQGVQSLCREYCAHEQMVRVETGRLHRGDTEFLANCMYQCFKSGGDTARGAAAHSGARLDK